MIPRGDLHVQPGVQEQLRQRRHYGDILRSQRHAVIGRKGRRVVRDVDGSLPLDHHQRIRQRHIDRGKRHPPAEYRGVARIDRGGPG